MRERFPSASVEFQVFRGGKRVRMSLGDVRRAARVAARLAHLSGPAVGRLRDVLGREISPFAVDENGWTDLHWAAALNSSELAKALLDLGADVSAALHQDAEPLSDRLMQSMRELGLKLEFPRVGYQPLHIAVLADAKDALAVLFAAGAETDARAKQSSFTLLHMAASADSKKVAPVLVERGADVNAKNTWGETPLHLAARRNAGDVAAVLIERGADVNAKSNEVSGKSNTGLTPLHLAARQNAEDVAAVLIERGADVNAKGNMGFGRSNTGLTPLHLAARRNAEDVAAVLIERGADVNAKSNTGLTPLHLAARQNAE
ncbi:MAG: ankyrin repeat domain-containing protein, partial [Rhodospirillaceae bacterium]|nr:ankyrin repeat domain-containing protein [Rhodospirillaceae bacterium]